MSHVAPKSMYYTIFSALMVLTALTVFAAFTDLGVLNFPVAIGIAITKATLVILFFMHVREASRLTKLFVAGTFIWLLVMFAFTFTDYMSRYQLPMSNGWDNNPTMIRPTATPATAPSTAPSTAPAPVEHAK